MPRPGSSPFSLLSEASLLLLAVGPTVAIGGVHRPVQLAAALLSVLCLGLVWLNRRPGERGLHIPLFGVAMLALTAVNLLQLVPLPLGLLKVVAPTTADILHVSLARAGGVPSAHPISLNPGATLWEALKLACYSLAFIAAHNFYGRSGRRRRLMSALVGLGIVLTFLGLVGAVVAPGKPLLLYTPEAGSAAGMITTSFVNPNHGSGFLIICVLLAMGLAADSKDLQRKVMLAMAAVLLGAGVALSLSRAGIFVLALGMVAFSMLAFRSRAKGNLGQVAVILPCVAALIILLAGWLAYDRLVVEFASFSLGDEGGLGKIALWPAGLSMVLANPWVGVGRGAFITSFPRYMQGDIRQGTFDYLENQFIQLPAEVGLVLGCAFILVAALALVTWVRRGIREGKEVAAGAAILALAAHNLFDFSFEIFGVGLPLCLLAGALSANSRRHRAGKASTLLGLAATGATTVLLVATAIIHPSSAVEDDRVLAKIAKSGAPLQQYIEAANQTIRRRPSDYLPHLTAAHQAIRVGDPGALAMLNRALFLFPRSPAIHLMVARAVRRFGGNQQQYLMEYRLAMENGARHKPVLKEALPFCRTEQDLRSLLPADVSIHASAVRQLREAGRLKLALPLVERGVRRWPADSDICLERAWVLLNSKDKEGISAARSCMELDPSIAATIMLARAVAAMGAAREEIQVFKQGLEMFPESVVLAEHLAQAHVSHREYKHALEAAERILDLAQKWEYRVRAHQLMAHILRKQGREHSARFHDNKAKMSRMDED